MDARQFEPGDLNFSERNSLGRSLKTMRMLGLLEHTQYISGLFHFGLKPDFSGWCAFCKRVFNLLGLLLFLVGLAMFLAWNWIAMSVPLKFAIFELVFALCSVMAIWRWKRESGAYWLFGAGISIGLLLALYGQVYQTGANAWELFRVWALAVLPLFLLARTSCLGLLLWLTLSLWVALYSREFSFSLYDAENIFLRGNMLLYQQLACWFFCECLHQIAGKLNLPAFDPARRLVRFIGAVALTLLTVKLMALVLLAGYYYRGVDMSFFGNSVVHVYLAALAAIFIFYYKKKPDLFFISLGCFSAAGILTTMILRSLFRVSLDEGGALLTAGLLVVGMFIGSGLLILRIRGALLSAQRADALPGQNNAEAGPDRGGKLALLLKNWLGDRPDIQDGLIADVLGTHAREEAGRQPWYFKLPMSLGIWIGALLLGGAIFIASDGVLLEDFWVCVPLIALGAWLFRSDNFSVQQLGLVCILSGLVLGIPALDDHPRTGLLCYALIFLALWATVKYPSARVICMAAALGFLFFYLDYYSYMEQYSYYRYADNAGYVRHGDGAFMEKLAQVPPLGTGFFALATAFSLAVLGTGRKKISAGTPFLESAAGGALLFVMLAAGYFFCLNAVLHIPLGVPAWVDCLFYGVPLGILCGAIFLLCANTGPAYVKLACIPAILFLIVIGYSSPVSALGLVLLFFAKGGRDLVLMGFASVYLALGITFFYYNIQFAFVRKAVLMMGSGVTLLALAVIAATVLPGLAAGRGDGVRKT
ncbi:MAG: DUF4401 domain-containing protein [Deltaproteobacteria bacterium]|nr:DUF4401 domain-containing protein [Deltaproteobacteria bacterium]